MCSHASMIPVFNVALTRDSERKTMSAYARFIVFTSLLLCASVSSAQEDSYRLPNKTVRSDSSTASRPKTLTNQSIVALTKAEVSDDLIIRKIRGSDCRFDTSPDAIEELKANGVSKSVLHEMINVSTPLPAIPASERATSPIGAKFYVAPMPEGFDGFIHCHSRVSGNPGSA